MAQHLPDDILADVLRRLPPRSLAASRCACRAWRDAVDARGLLPPTDRLLPRAPPGGVFCNLCETRFSQFFAHPSSVRRAISGSLDYAFRDEVRDHCGGLLLLADGSVANPATRQCALLPDQPPLRAGERGGASLYRSYLVHDPAVSPHYEVLSVPDSNDYWERRVVEDSSTSPYHLLVFSSRTWRWEERTFLHEEGETAVVDAGRAVCLLEKYGVYWQDALYVYWHTHAITRISLSTNKYRLIQLPADPEQNIDYYLGKSNKGVYCASIHNSCHLQIWLLNVASCDQMEWVLKHDTYLKPTLPHVDYFNQVFFDDKFRGPWTLQEECDEDDDDDSSVDDDAENQVEEWDSDTDGFVQIDETVRGETFRILGFHPYKKVIFLEEVTGKGVAYHWKSSKYQYLGKLYTGSYRKETWEQSITASFPYTPCWIDLFRGIDY